MASTGSSGELRRRDEQMKVISKAYDIDAEKRNRERAEWRRSGRRLRARAFVGSMERDIEQAS